MTIRPAGREIDDVFPFPIVVQPGKNSVVPIPDIIIKYLDT